MRPSKQELEEIRRINKTGSPGTREGNRSFEELWKEMKLARGIEVLDLPHMGKVTHPTLIFDANTAILVDTGWPGQLPEIRKMMDEAGVPFSKLGNIVITHQDIDHIGNLSAIVKASDQAINVIAHREEKPYLEGEKPLIKMTPERLAQMFDSLPESRRQDAGAKFVNSLLSKVGQTVEDGEVLPFCGGLTVIYTPGHTPGHISLYHAESRTLITGDALNVVEGQLTGPNPVFTQDMKTAMNSLRKLAGYDIETAICYHGGVFGDRVNDRITKLIT